MPGFLISPLNPAQTCISHVYVIANLHNQGYFCSIIQNMKAVFQNTLYSIACMVTVVLAAPTQTITRSQKMVQAIVKPAEKSIEPVKSQPVTPEKATETPISIEEGTVRFACW